MNLLAEKCCQYHSDRYSNVQSIIDYLEIEIGKPSDARVQAQTWSEYKKANTMEYLVYATSNGLSNFVSAGYGGRITDTNILEHSGFLKNLPNNCQVMADRGFKSIASLLARKNCELIRPLSDCT